MSFLNNYYLSQNKIKLTWCFLLLFHKAQLVDLKSELTETQAEKVVLEKEVHDQLLQLHSIQLQLHAQTGQSVDSGTIKAKLVSSLEGNIYVHIF